MKFPGLFISSGQVDRTPTSVVVNRAFDVALSQYFVDGVRDVRSRWTLPDGKRFENTKVPPPNTSVAVVGPLTDVEEEKPSCIVSDFILGSSNQATAKSQNAIAGPSTQSKFNWGQKRKRRE